MSESLDMSLAGVNENSQINQHSKDILKKFHWAIKQVSNENRTDEEENTQLTQDELIQLIKTWEPQRDIICLYVRWARQLRRNFNLDSIATLLCLSRQCNYTPVDFLRKVKTLSVYKNGKGIYGVSFHFDIPNRNDINREHLSKEFLGLSVTLALLQEQVTESPSILGKTGMRQRSPRSVYPMDIPIEGHSKQHAQILTHPTIEFHTKSSLLSRIWVSISHRWLALFFTEHMFREVDIPWSYLDALVFTFQMMAPCGPCRYEFLSPLAGYCLRFRSLQTIECKRTKLRQIWSDPSLFLSYGNTCLTQFSTEAKSHFIVECFQELRSEIPPKSKQISYHRDCSWHRRWTILRAYIFHYWLDSASNRSIKAIVTTSLNVGSKKRKVCAAQSEQRETDTTPTKIAHTMLKKVPPRQSPNGLHSITSTRRTSIQCATTERDDPSSSKIVGGKVLGSSNDNSNMATTDNSNMATTTGNKQKVSGVKPIKDTDWTSLRLVTSQEMQSLVRSFLLVHRLDGVDVIADLSPLEVYSANNLHDWTHCRLSGKPPFSPSQKIGHVKLHIDSEADYFIDHAAKSFHVARVESQYMLEHAHHLPAMDQIRLLCEAIVSHGSVDSKRAVGQYRVNIGNGGQNWINGAPCKLHGLQFEKDLKNDLKFDAAEVLNAIGQLAEFTWLVMCGLQNDTSDHPIAPDASRKQLYAAALNEYLNMGKEVGFEDLTLVVSSLHPTIHEVLEHKDTMNDTLAGYTRTAAFNMVMIDNNDEAPTLLHLQVICNFRKVIGRYLVAFHKYLAPTAKHARSYMEKWNHSMQLLFAGKTEKIPSAYDRSTFFLDDTLEYTIVSISDEGKHKQSISSEYILTEINVSRTLSLSMFIDPLVKLQRHLKFDQTIELAFACSFLSNPFWFDWTMSTLIQRLDDTDNPYEFGLHPFYDWSHMTIEIFGSWQGGPYNRWSPCGGSKETVLETFGAQPGATKEVRERGEQKLSQVVAILWDHLTWINSLSSCGNKPLVDMPLDAMKAKCNSTIKEISKIASCQFSHFRLGILTTIISGCGLLREGKHLRNLMYPVKGSASYKHLGCPVADFMSPERARALGANKTTESISNDGEGAVAENHHDLFMQYLSAELGFKVYVRDEIECILCESHPMRSLNCRDWFRKGMTIYDCNHEGEFLYREYGKDSPWIKLHPPDEYQFAYLGKSSIQYIPLDVSLSYFAVDFGAELRSDHSKKVKYKGRNSRNSSHQRTFTNKYQLKETFCHPSLQVANFYSGSYVFHDKLQSIFVLEDAQHAVATSECNNLDNYKCGKRLHGHLQSLLTNNKLHSSPMAAGCFHMDADNNTYENTFFPGHLDKPFVHTAWFVPLGPTAFFTILSVPRACESEQDAESLLQFKEWKSLLSISESRHIDDFLRDFDVQAQKFSGVDSLVQRIYLSKRGSVLSFPANRIYHATIIPKKNKGFPRDLFVFHPLDGLSR